jgi:transcription initiation factor TFIIIB Brf1 subunit/transcription initiation factor TFIIB
MTDIASMWAEFETLRSTQQPKPVATTQKNTEFFCSCGGVKVKNIDNLPTCTSCGACDTMFIDDSAEWTSGVDDTGKVSDPSRCGAPQDLELFSEQWGNSTVMRASGRSTWAMKRQAKINFHMSMNHRDRALYHAYKDIDAAATSALQLPANVARQAKIFYRKFNESKLTRGAIRDGIKANCIMYACKLNNVPRSTKEIAEAYGIPTKDISRTHDIFKKEIMSSDETTASPESTAITKPTDLVSRLLQNFQIGGNRRAVIVRCKKLCEKVEGCVDLMGKTPNSIASVVILMAVKPSKQEVCKNCGISMPTLNKIEIVVKKYLEENSIEY